MIAFLNLFTAYLGLISERLNSKSLGDCAILISYLVGLSLGYLEIDLDFDPGIFILNLKKTQIK